MYFGVRPWEIPRLFLDEFDRLARAADELLAMDTRFARRDSHG